MQETAATTIKMMSLMEYADDLSTASAGHPATSTHHVVSDRVHVWSAGSVGIDSV